MFVFFADVSVPRCACDRVRLWMRDWMVVA